MKGGTRRGAIVHSLSTLETSRVVGEDIPLRNWQGSEFVPASQSSRLPEGLSPETQRRLIVNGTYNPDGTVYMRTVERLSWTKSGHLGSLPRRSDNETRRSK
jgi:hypothetical protein